MQCLVDKLVRQIDRTLAVSGDRFPHYTENAEWIITEDGSWTGGMWVGQLWMAYRWTGNTRYRDRALRLLPKLERRIDSVDANFDLGFLLVPSFVQAYEFFGDKNLRRVALRGAERMLDFFNPKAGLIYTVYPERAIRDGRAVGSAIVDVMMNLSLLWWAYRETADSRYRDIASQHALRTAELHVRADGSTFHVVDFELETGKVLHRGTIHGYSDRSTWARGQAWGLHGFAMAYLATRNPTFHETAERLSTYFARRLPPNGQSYWDLCDPSIPAADPDTSATAIAASGWLSMDGRWPDLGKRLLEGLAASQLNAEAQGILSNSTAYKMQGRGVRGATTWGDYFLLQGLQKIWGHENGRPWI